MATKKKKGEEGKIGSQRSDCQTNMLLQDTHTKKKEETKLGVNANWRYRCNHNKNKQSRNMDDCRL